MRDLLLWAKHLFVAAILAGTASEPAYFLKERDTTTRQKSSGFDIKLLQQLSTRHPHLEFFAIGKCKRQ